MKYIYIYYLQTIQGKDGELPMDLFGRKARNENAYLKKLLLCDKEALKKAKNLLQIQEHKIYKLEQEVQFLKMINEQATIDYPNSRKEN